jgi:hypothetical protein
MPKVASAPIAEQLVYKRDMEMWPNPEHTRIWSFSRHLVGIVVHEAHCTVPLNSSRSETRSNKDLVKRKGDTLSSSIASAWLLS